MTDVYGHPQMRFLLWLEFLRPPLVYSQITQVFALRHDARKVVNLPLMETKLFYPVYVMNRVGFFGVFGVFVFPLVENIPPLCSVSPLPSHPILHRAPTQTEPSRASGPSCSRPPSWCSTPSARKNPLQWKNPLASCRCSPCPLLVYPSLQVSHR
jgi:hypothetical protein